MAVKTKVNKKHALNVKFAAYVVVERGNKLLLKRRFNTEWDGGCYSFAAGHVEKGETFKHAAARELKEESNLKAKEGFLELVHVVDVAPTSLQCRYFHIYYRCKKWSGKVKNNEPNKCDDLRWFDKKNLPKKFSPISLQAWKNIEKGIRYSEWGWKK